MFIIIFYPINDVFLIIYHKNFKIRDSKLKTSKTINIIIIFITIILGNLI